MEDKFIPLERYGVSLFAVPLVSLDVFKIMQAGWL